MKENDAQLPSQIVVLGEVQETLEEQARISTGLSDSVQALTNHSTKQEQQSQEENME